MHDTSWFITIALIIAMSGCSGKVSNEGKGHSSSTAATNTPLPGSNAGSDKKLIEQVRSWTFHLMAGQNRIATYQFNQSGTVVATVGSKETPMLKAMFWRIDEKNQIAISDEKDFSVLVESWRILASDDQSLTVWNEVSDREERYTRARSHTLIY